MLSLWAMAWRPAAAPSFVQGAAPPRCQLLLRRRRRPLMNEAASDPAPPAGVGVGEDVLGTTSRRSRIRALSWPSATSSSTWRPRCARRSCASCARRRSRSRPPTPTASSGRTSRRSRSRPTSSARAGRRRRRLVEQWPALPRHWRGGGLCVRRVGPPRAAPPPPLRLPVPSRLGADAVRALVRREPPPYTAPADLSARGR